MTSAADYTTADANVTLADVKFDVSGAKDLACNSLVAAPRVSTLFPYTTLFRSVTSVTLSDPHITDSDSGATVTATISFSEAMDQSSTPTISDNEIGRPHV